MAKHSPGAEGPTPDRLRPELDGELLIDAPLAALLQARVTLQAALQRKRPFTIESDRAAQLFVRGAMHFPEDAEAVREILSELAAVIRGVRAELRELHVLECKQQYAARREAVLTEQRLHRDELLKEPLPRMELPGPSAPDEERARYNAARRSYLVFGRSTLMFSASEDRIPGLDERSPYTESPPSPEVLPKVWEHVLVVDPDDMSPRLWFPYGFKDEDSEQDNLDKRAAQIPTLKGMLAAATPLETPKGERTRVLVLHGVHGGMDMEGCTLTSRTRPESEKGGPEMVAVMSRNIYRVQRERSYVVEGTRDEAAAFEGFTMEVRELLSTLAGWKGYAKEEKDELRGRVLETLERLFGFLGTPRRKKLQRAREVRGKVLGLLNNPNAMMATMRILPEILDGIGELGRSRAATVTTEKDALADEVGRFHRLRDRGRSWTERLFAHPRFAELSASSLAQSLRAMVALVDEYGSTLQPFLSMSADVRRVAQAAIVVAEGEAEGWRESFTAHAIALDTLFRGQELVERGEDVQRLLSMSRRKQEAIRSAPRTLAQGLECMDAIVDGAEDWAALVHPGLPGSARAVRETLGQLENLALAARMEPHPLSGVRTLRDGLDALDLLENYDQLADIVCKEIGLERPPSPGRASDR